MAHGHKVQITLGKIPGPDASRIELDGVDITDAVQAIRIEAKVGEPTLVILEIPCEVECEADAAQVLKALPEVEAAQAPDAAGEGEPRYFTVGPAMAPERVIQRRPLAPTGAEVFESAEAARAHLKRDGLEDQAVYRLVADADTFYTDAKTGHLRLGAAARIAPL